MMGWFILLFIFQTFGMEFGLDDNFHLVSFLSQ